MHPPVAIDKLCRLGIMYSGTDQSVRFPPGALPGDTLPPELCRRRTAMLAFSLNFPSARTTACSLLVPAFCLLLAGCNQAPAAKKDKVIEVTVTTPITDSVIDYQDFTGRLDAVN